jgi:plastocyanin
MTSAFAFSPKVLIVRPADVVVWTNDSGMMHDVTPDPGAPVTMESDASFPAGMMNGDRFRWTVPLNLARGTYFYHCDFHGSAGSGSGFGGGMVGAITVK